MTAACAIAARARRAIITAHETSLPCAGGQRSRKVRDFRAALAQALPTQTKKSNSLIVTHNITHACLACKIGRAGEGGGAPLSMFDITSDFAPVSM